jgi:hypothetical protein
MLFIGEMFTATAMAYFEHEIARAVVLALFIPLIISSGGNSGSQASTLVVRALSLGELGLRDWWRVAGREVVSGLALGAILGLIGFVRISLWQAAFHLYGDKWFLLAVTVATSLIGVVMWGSLAGSMLPLLLKGVGLRSGRRVGAAGRHAGRRERHRHLLRRREHDPAWLTRTRLARAVPIWKKVGPTWPEIPSRNVRKGLEEEFFAKREATLVAKLRQTLEKGAPAGDPEAAHRHPGRLHHRHAGELHVDRDTLAAFALYPLVEVAWADGKVDERRAQGVSRSSRRAWHRRRFAGHETLRQFPEGSVPREEARKAWFAWAEQLNAGVRRRAPRAARMVCSSARARSPRRAAASWAWDAASPPTSRRCSTRSGPVFATD